MTNIPVQQTPSDINKSHSGMMKPFEELEKLFEDFGTKGWMRPFHWDSRFLNKATDFESRIPNVDVVECDGEIQIKAEMPGIDKKDLDVSMTKNSVTIKANSKHEEEEKEGDYYRREITQGSFTRTLRLPAEVDENKVKAKFKNGVLELILTKSQKEDRHKIKID